MYELEKNFFIIGSKEVSEQRAWVRGVQGDPLRLGPRARKGSHQVIMNLFVLHSLLLYNLFAS